jgi:hypothetical protein
MNRLNPRFDDDRVGLDGYHIVFLIRRPFEYVDLEMLEPAYHVREISICLIADDDKACARHHAGNLL